MNVGDVNDGWDKVRPWVQAEVDARGGSVRAAAAQSGVDARTIQKLLDGEKVTRRDALIRLCNAWMWPADAFDRIRAGKDPVGPSLAVGGKPLKVAITWMDGRTAEAPASDRRAVEALVRPLGDDLVRQALEMVDAIESGAMVLEHEDDDVDRLARVEAQLDEVMQGQAEILRRIEELAVRRA